MKALKLKSLLGMLAASSLLISAVLIFISIRLCVPSKATVGSQPSEVRYLIAEITDDENECSDSLQLDSRLIEGGVIKVAATEYYLKTANLLEEDAETPLDAADCMYRIISYAGIFGWELRECSDNLLYFVHV